MKTKRSDGRRAVNPAGMSKAMGMEMRTGGNTSMNPRYWIVVVIGGAQHLELAHDAIPPPPDPGLPGQLAIWQLPGPQQHAGSDFDDLAIAPVVEALQRTNEYGSALPSRLMLNKIVSHRSFKPLPHHYAALIQVYHKLIRPPSCFPAPGTPYWLHMYHISAYIVNITRVVSPDGAQ